MCGGSAMNDSNRLESASTGRIGSKSEGKGYNAYDSLVLWFSFLYRSRLDRGEANKGI